MAERAACLSRLAPAALETHVVEDTATRYRAFARDPVGVVLQVAPWNYPYLTVINTLAAAILAGNTFLLKHSTYTPLCGDHFASAFAAAGAPDLVQTCFIDWREIESVIAEPEIGYVSFVGSTGSGK
jgi:acyl-CoA reductase-like NAD-dependent aldehyde dehydrogenase